MYSTILPREENLAIDGRVPCMKKKLELNLVGNTCMMVNKEISEQPTTQNIFFHIWATICYKQNHFYITKRKINTQR